MLINQVKAHVTANAAVQAIHPDVRAKLEAAVSEFMLAPDEFVDVGRLPSSVVDLDSLFTFLRTIQQKLASRDNRVANADWEVAKSGELRLYKLYVCGIHALHTYVNGTPDFTKDPSAFCEAVMTHARGNPPANLAKNGTTLWNKTFEGTQPRTLSVLKSLLYFCRQPAVQSPAVPVAGGVVPVGGGGKGGAAKPKSGS